jgi:hypothetical protein
LTRLLDPLSTITLDSEVFIVLATGRQRRRNG